MKIPFVDLKAQYQSIKNEIDSAMSRVMDETAFIGGSSNKYVTGFEREFASFLNLNHVVSCANGTDSIEILLEAFNIGRGDEVIVPALSWISTSEAVGRIGAKPVFVDVCQDTLLMDIEKIEEKINEKTKAIIPVHLYGNAMDMEEIMKLAEKHKLKVIEDCAQSHEAAFNGKMVGTFGHASSFSFYPGKNLGAYGDAGCIATNSEELAAKCRMIANHGQLQKHNHVIEGRNSRMDGLHGAVLSVKLKYLSDWNKKRIANSANLSALVDNKKYTCPVVNKNARHVFHLYVIRHTKRDELKQYLGDKGIETAIHYPTALPFLKAYESMGYKQADFPVAFAETQKILSIPMFPELTSEQMTYLAETLNAFK
ncbi:MAG: DegT/DnrJ/EryC1/StrS family aminotransferase [Bacteroidota bacterium]